MSITSYGQLATLDFNGDLNIAYGPLQRETRSYNNLLQLTAIQVAYLSGGTPLLDLSYSYPAGANRTVASFLSPRSRSALPRLINNPSGAQGHKS